MEHIFHARTIKKFKPRAGIRTGQITDNFFIDDQEHPTS